MGKMMTGTIVNKMANACTSGIKDFIKSLQDGEMSDEEFQNKKQECLSHLEFVIKIIDGI